MSYSNEEEKKSSATAKTALGLGIAGLSLAGINSGLLGGGNGNGILGGLFGNRNDALEVYRTTMYDQGQKAEAELSVVNNYFMPTWREICELKKEVAVNKAVDAKNQEITALMFQLAEQKATCCCDKTNDKIDYLAALSEQRSNSYFARLASDIECANNNLNTKIDYTAKISNDQTNCNFNRLNDKIDSAFAIESLKADAKLCEATKNTVRGSVYLSPSNLANPYVGGTDYLVSRSIGPRGCGFNTYDTGCSCGCGW